MKNKNIISTVVFAMIFLIISLSCWAGPEVTYSHSERRELAKKPPFSLASVLSGEFMEGFDEYTADSFPARDSFRRIKALFSGYVLGKKDNNGLYTSGGHISKIEYPVNEPMVDNAVQRFNYLYDTYMKNTDVNVYLSIIPDKNYFLASKNGYPSIDYGKFTQDFKNRLDYMQYIDIFPLLTIDDYYRTDSHWRQEEICDVAEHISRSMGAQPGGDYTVNTLDTAFEGVYLGQSALPFEPDTIKYLTNDTLTQCKVSYFDTGAAVEGDMYNMEKAHGKDAYEMFLSGTTPLVEIENPNAASERELIVFRDSFGGSLVPLLAEGYSKITAVDIRYLQSSFVGNFVKFDNQDVLFLYSTTLLNNSMSMR